MEDLKAISLNRAVFTVKNVMNRSEEILYVVRDSDDGLQFLPGGAVSMDDMMIVGLGEILQIDPTVGDLNLEGDTKPPGIHHLEHGKSEKLVSR